MFSSIKLDMSDRAGHSGKSKEFRTQGPRRRNTGTIWIGKQMRMCMRRLGSESQQKVSELPNLTDL
jgi:hypothetical protein